jgi:23S rRNA (cytosine1962-C5)-methyltransferase
VYSGALDLERAKAEIEPGDLVTVRTAEGGFVAQAGWSPLSQIRARVWTFREGEVVDAAFVRARIVAACDRRTQWGFGRRNALRLVHGESDLLPGLVIDAYNDVLVFSISSAVMEPWRATIIDTIASMRKPRAIVERSDADVRSIEGLAPRNALALGTLDAKVEIDEHGITYEVDVMAGHKTGFYLDQSDNRRLLRSLTTSKRVLNCFCYTGGFSLAAWLGGAEQVISIDSSADALALAAQNATRNAHAPGLEAQRLQWAEADVFEYLRKARDKGEQFDVIVLDPPKFAPTAAHAEKAARAYKDINLWGMKLLAPGGLLMTYSCSGGVSDELFQKIVAGAAVDAKVDMQIIKRLAASADHPVALTFPEGHYLKGLLLARA